MIHYDVKYSDVTSGGLNPVDLQTHSYQELCSNQAPRLSFAGFCQGGNHLPRQWSNANEDVRFVYYEVRGLRGRAYLMTQDKSKSFCRCGEALFWARHYKKIEVNDEQSEARKIAGIY